jgi:hypothetical protein
MERVDRVIDVKQAVQIAKEKAAELLGSGAPGLEEIERDSYKDREVWSVTLSFPKDAARLRGLDRIANLSGLSIDPFEYKRFLIDAETGDLTAIKLREFAPR